MANKKSFFQTYRLIPIIIGSIFLFALISALALLVWSLIAYLTKADISSAETLPIVVWLAALFVTVTVMTILTRGGTVFPAVFLSIVTVVVSCFFVEPALLSIIGILTKLGLSLLTAIVAFTLTKLIYIGINSSRQNRYEEQNTTASDLKMQDLDREPPPEPPGSGQKLF